MTLEAHPNGEIAACFNRHSVGLGKFSAGAADRAKHLRAGLPLGSFVSDGEIIDKEIFSLVRQLAGHGLLEYRLGRSGNGEDQVVIEPQMPDYWPRTPQLDSADTLVLSRFAYMRRRGNAMVLESPRAGALFQPLVSRHDVLELVVQQRREIGVRRSLKHVQVEIRKLADRGR